MKGSVFMIQAYSQNLAVTQGAAIPFNSTKLKTGCVVTQAQDKTTFYLNRPGIYLVQFDGYGSSTEAGSVGVQMAVDGVNCPVGTVQATTAAGSLQPISFYTLVGVEAVCRCTGGKKLTVNYTGTAGTLSLANIIITKLR